MTIDPIEHYGVSPEIAEAMMEVLGAIARREGGKLPSNGVIGKALTMLGGTDADGEEYVSHHVSPAIVYKVPSRSQPGRKHLVALYVQGNGPKWQNNVIDAECSCDATVMCNHLLIALTYAERDGYHLETGS